jgi:outer membrane receptor protein involved in Fe transport
MRAAKAFLLLLLSLLLPAAGALGQSGKISGRVTEGASGDPLPGVNIVIDGTSTGAVSDADGYYDIINVRPGVYQLRISFIGYTTKLVDNVDVNTGLTTTVDVTLDESTVDLEEVIVTAETPIIQRDISASQRTIEAVEIQSGRYQGVNNVLTAQVSVNEVGAFEDRPEIRGSGLDESLFLVDGVSQGDALTNQAFYQVNLDAVEEIQVLTGGFSAEYGNVRSGVISVVTKEGGEQYTGSANVQYSPAAQRHWGPNVFAHDSPIVDPFVNPGSGAFTGNDFFDGWDNVAASLGEGDAHAGQPMELYALYLWRHRSQDSIDELRRLQEQGLVQFAPGVNPDDEVFHEYGVLPDTRASFTFGGPVPGIRPLKFFVAYDRTETEYSYRFPQLSYKEGNVRGKLTMNVTPAV